MDHFPWLHDRLVLHEVGHSADIHLLHSQGYALPRACHPLPATHLDRVTFLDVHAVPSRFLVRDVHTDGSQTDGHR